MNGADLFDNDQFRGLVLRHDAELANLKGIPELVDRVRKDVLRMEALADKQSDLLTELMGWKEDSKVVRIAELKGQLEMKERIFMFWQRLAAIALGLIAISVASLWLKEQAQMAVGGAGLLLAGWGLPFFREASKKNSLPPPSKP